MNIAQIVPPAPDSFEALASRLATYLLPEDVGLVERAYHFGAHAHLGQVRLTGEPYIGHPLAVARILSDMHMDAQTVAAAILHDVIEDTEVGAHQLTSTFGVEVAELVDAVSKLTQIRFENREEAQAAYFRKMLLAVSRDLRVMMIKLADRLHNMRTVQYLPRAKRQRVARETLDIYAPIAHRLGMHIIHQELENLSFAAIYPLRYRVIAEAIRAARGNRSDVIGKVDAAIRQRMTQENLPFRLLGREKHPYSVYKKMRKDGRALEKVHDIYAVRLIVSSPDACYRALGVVHSIYKPLPLRFRDYIAIPKANGYQSLHTTVFTPYGVELEVQLRTEDMDLVAESGVAAHWLYKTGEASGVRAHQRANEWLLGLVDTQAQGGDAREFLDTIKGDLFPDEVYVFTPKGRILALPAGATALDFAYAVHSDIGDRAVAVRINGAMAPLSSALESGATVEVLTAKTATPHPSWLEFVVTGKARTAIRHFLKDLNREKAVELGARLLDRELAKQGLKFPELPEPRVAEFLAHCRVATMDDVLEDIGLGKRMALLVAQQLVDGPASAQAVTPERASGLRRALKRMAPTWFVGAAPRRPPVAIRGTEGVVVSYARCCLPIPGDRIRGFVSAGRGVVIHVENCPNTAEYRRQPDKWLDVVWDATAGAMFQADLRLEVQNGRGQLAVLAAAIADTDTNIEAVSIGNRDGYHSVISFTVEVHDRLHLARVLRRLRAVKGVRRITRKRG